MSPLFLRGETQAFIMLHCIFNTGPRAFHALPCFILNRPGGRVRARLSNLRMTKARCVPGEQDSAKKRMPNQPNRAAHRDHR